MVSGAGHSSGGCPPPEYVFFLEELGVGPPSRNHLQPFLTLPVGCMALLNSRNPRNLLGDRQMGPEDSSLFSLRKCTLGPHLQRLPLETRFPGRRDSCLHQGRWVPVHTLCSCLDPGFSSPSQHQSVSPAGGTTGQHLRYFGWQSPLWEVGSH